MQVLLPLLEEGKQERRYVLIHFHFQFRPSEITYTDCTQQQGMRNNRTTVRSLVTTQGTCLAMSDGLVIWETPANRRTLHLRTTATAMLG